VNEFRIFMENFKCQFPSLFDELSVTLAAQQLRPDQCIVPRKQAKFMMKNSAAVVQSQSFRGLAILPRHVTTHGSHHNGPSARRYVAKEFKTVLCSVGRWMETL
jgi:hypothetical protein